MCSFLFSLYFCQDLYFALRFRLLQCILQKCFMVFQLLEQLITVISIFLVGFRSPKWSLSLFKINNYTVYRKYFSLSILNIKFCNRVLLQSISQSSYYGFGNFPSFNTFHYKMLQYPKSNPKYFSARSNPNFLPSQTLNILFFCLIYLYIKSSKCQRFAPFAHFGLQKPDLRAFPWTIPGSEILCASAEHSGGQ